MTEDGEPRGPIWVLFVIVIALGIWYASHPGEPPEREEAQRLAHESASP
ncbi:MULTISPECIES: hypothetical protein [Anaeromyxobacter]|nr:MULTISPECIES: hypothetical protein [unclassified Anaeromyxobacter]